MTTYRYVPAAQRAREEQAAQRTRQEQRWARLAQLHDLDTLAESFLPYLQAKEQVEGNPSPTLKWLRKRAQKRKTGRFPWEHLTNEQLGAECTVMLAMCEALVADYKVLFSPTATKEADVSHDRTRELLHGALRAEKIAAGIDPERVPCWVREVYDGYFVYEEGLAGIGERLYKRDYRVGDDGVVQLGAPEQVVPTTAYLPAGDRSIYAQAFGESELREALSIRVGGALIEAADVDGWAWRIQIIRAGESANGNNYPLPVLHEAAPIYAGVPVFYGRGPDHNKDERGFASIAGYITASKPNPAGVEGVLEINKGKPEVRAAIGHAWDVQSRTGKSIFGFSHVIPRDGVVAEARKPRGWDVRQLTRCESVDIVMVPAAGGQLLSPV